MNQRLLPHLDSMRRAATNAISFVGGMSLEAFTTDEKTQAAAAMCLAIVGESANKIATEVPDFVDTHPDWAWDQMRGLRNRIVHSYEILDLPIIWSTVNDFLPQLLAAIAEAMPTTEPLPPQIGS